MIVIQSFRILSVSARCMQIPENDHGQPRFIPLGHQLNNKMMIDIDGNTYFGHFSIHL